MGQYHPRTDLRRSGSVAKAGVSGNGYLAFTVRAQEIEEQARIAERVELVRSYVRQEVNQLKVRLRGEGVPYVTDQLVRNRVSDSVQQNHRLPRGTKIPGRVVHEEMMNAGFVPDTTRPEKPFYGIKRATWYDPGQLKGMYSEDK